MGSTGISVFHGPNLIVGLTVGVEGLHPARSGLFQAGEVGMARHAAVSGLLLGQFPLRTEAVRQLGGIAALDVGSPVQRQPGGHYRPFLVRIRQSSGVVRSGCSAVLFRLSCGLGGLTGSRAARVPHMGDEPAAAQHEHAAGGNDADGFPPRIHTSQGFFSGLSILRQVCERDVLLKGFRRRQHPVGKAL